MFEKLKELKETADKAGQIIELIQTAQHIDADGDGKADAQEFVEIGLRAIGKMNRIKEQVEDVQGDFAELAKLAGQDFEVIVKKLGIEVPGLPAAQ